VTARMIQHGPIHPRIVCGAPCAVFFQGFRLPGTVRNISIRGVYVVLSEPLPPVDSRVVLTFSLAGDRTHIACEGSVRWLNEPSIVEGCGITRPNLPPGCGVEFLRLDTLDRQRIDALIRLAAMRQTRLSPVS
jgi:PilZ domain-containing protein